MKRFVDNIIKLLNKSDSEYINHIAGNILDVKYQILFNIWEKGVVHCNLYTLTPGEGDINTPSRRRRCIYSL